VNPVFSIGLTRSLAVLTAATLALPVALRAAPAAPPEETTRPEYLHEVISHLYRWYLDEVDLAKSVKAKNEVLWVRPLNPPLDAGDRSRYAEILLPVVEVTAKVKMADYAIEELGVTVKNDTFKIVQVGRGDMPEDLEERYTPVNLDREALSKFLFAHRNESIFPDEQLMNRVRLAVGDELRDEYEADGNVLEPGEEHTLYVAPISPVANELYVFWETGRSLIRFASDLDLTNPAVWAHEDLAVKIWDIDEQVVVSLEQVAGSNAYLTRDQIGRALFNCVVLGRRMEIVTRTEEELERIRAILPGS